MKKVQVCLLLSTLVATAGSAYAATSELGQVNAVADGGLVRIEVSLSSSVRPKIEKLDHSNQLVVDFPETSVSQPEQILVNRNGVQRIYVQKGKASASLTRMVVVLTGESSYRAEKSGGKFELNILPATSPAERASAATRKSTATNAGVTIEATAPREAFPQAESSASFATLLSDDQPAKGRTTFRIKYVAGNSAYVDGGSGAGLREGMKLVIHESNPFALKGAGRDGLVAEARVVAVATASAVTEVRSFRRKPKVGDVAILTPEDAAKVGGDKVLSMVDDTPRQAILSTDESRPPGRLERVEKSRMQGRVGLDYSGISSRGSTPGASTQLGLSFQADMTHILGTHWNLQGYWRGRINRHSQFQQDEIEEGLNKIYTMQMYYDNPDSKWVAGFGRLYLPWAVSLDTIDGGYVGRKLRSGMTAGIFAGSTPDITSWNYQPDRRIGGSFVNFEGGAREGFYYSSTTGLALSTVQWKLNDPYLFFENEVSYKGRVSVYHSLIADQPHGLTTNGIRPGAGISHSYLTIHLQPSNRVSFDIYHNYFRDVPTAVKSIVGTGLVDKLLFQGVSAGVRFQPLRKVTLYTTLGTSSKTGDTHRTLNQMYGATWSEIAHSGLRADFHYTKFDSNFAQGNYRVLSLSRQVNNRIFMNFQVGMQDLVSALTVNNCATFIADSLDINLGKHSYLQSGYTWVNGATMNYRQWYLSWGYRFDQKQQGTEFVPTGAMAHGQ